MARSGRKGPGSGELSRHRPGKPSDLFLWLLAGGIVVIVAWRSVRQTDTELESAPSLEEQYPRDSVDERLDAVRSALFSEDAGGRPRGKSRFSEKEYWDERYRKTQEHYDWYGTWNSESNLKLKPHVFSSLPERVESILNIGCGNSRLPAELSEDGYRNITNIDISDEAIARMSKKFANHPGLSFIQMDITQMAFAADTFDVVFDKGTLDALYTGAQHLVQQAVPEIFRVLRPGGVCISTTFGPPKARRDLNWTFAGPEGDPRNVQGGWASFKTLLVDKDGGEGSGSSKFYIYIMTKPMA